MHFGRRVSQTFVMQISRTWKQAALAGLLGLALVGFAGARSASAAPTPTFDCTNGGAGPNLTLKIINNSSSYNIYPVVTAGARDDQPTLATGASQWMQACFRVSFNNLATQRYPRDSQYRFYVNCCDAGENGIPPNGSVTITLPFYSPLVQNIIADPDTKTEIPAQFINWWQGGGINMFQALASDGKPPSYLTEFWKADNDNHNAVAPGSATLGAKANPPTCGAGCSLHFFRAPSAVDSWAPNQLIEYTLGAAGPDGNAGALKPAAPNFLWVPTNLDYDVSNVNNTYMPAALEIDGNRLVGTCCAIGWVGSIASLETVFKNIGDWSKSSLGNGWPAYIDQHHKPNTVAGKVPSPLELFPNFNNTANFNPAPANSQPFKNMKLLWEQCYEGKVLPIPAICGRIGHINTLLIVNYNKYLNTYNASLAPTRDKTWHDVWGCELPAVALEEIPLLAHFYGWQPWNAESKCRADVNLLWQTPGYQPGDPGFKEGDPLHDYTPVKREFDDLQYWFNYHLADGDNAPGDYGQWDNRSASNYGQFDPYVALIHGKEFMNAPYTYAYSVDDAVGNYQADGTGLIVTVGGPQGLPNPDHVTREVQFTFGYDTNIASGPFNGLRITMDAYSRCDAAPEETNPTFTTFVVPAGNEAKVGDPVPPNSVTKCHVALRDSQGRNYRIQIGTYPSTWPLKPNPTPIGWPTIDQKHQWSAQNIICSGTGLDHANGDRETVNNDIATDFCPNVYPFQEIDLSNGHTLYKLSMPAPVACNLSPDQCTRPKPPLSALAPK
jgi:hypothetical protein